MAYHLDFLPFISLLFAKLPARPGVNRVRADEAGEMNDRGFIRPSEWKMLLKTRA
jgi:hypothetical protein